MRRLRAAATPAAFFLGLALTCASIIEIQRWPWVVTRLFRGDFEENLPNWWPELPFEPPSERLPQLVGIALAAAGLLGVLGLVLTCGHRRFLGEAFIVVAALCGWSFLGIVPVSSIHQLIQFCRFMPLMTETFSALIGLLIIGTIIIQGEKASRGGVLSAAAVATAMVAVTVHYAGSALEANEDACRPWHRYEAMELPDRPLLALGLLLACGLILSVARPAISNRVFAVFVLLAGIALSIPAVAIAHDARIEAHSAPPLSYSSRITTIAVPNCPPISIRLAPVIEVSASEVTFAGQVIGRTGSSDVESPLLEALVEMRKRDEDLHSQAGDADGFGGDVNLYADARTPMVTVAAISRACLRSGHLSLRIISLPNRPIEVWTRPMIHTHVCALQIELTDDGKPLSDFADWPSLVHAADRGEGKLRVSVK